MKLKQWNAWGEPGVSMALASDAQGFLQSLIGEGEPLDQVKMSQVLSAVPESRLSESPAYSIDKEDRLRHARGQSLPDWVAMKSGDFGVFPDAVAFPETLEQVEHLIELAYDNNYVLIPYGGGTSVAGHINPQAGDKPVITVSMAHMNRLLTLDETSQIARFEAGAAGPLVEAQLNARGYTLGHFPQSFEYSTLGGWVATRSSGQQSLKYGRIEDLFAGGTLVTPKGIIDISPLPASAAGSDFRQHILGSEGKFGIITHVEMRVSRLPEQEIFGMAFVHDWQSGIACLREVSQQGVALSMLRLSSEVETDTQLKLMVSPEQRKWLARLLKLKGMDISSCCMLLYGLTGTKQSNKQQGRLFKQVLKKVKGFHAGPSLARHWKDKRFTSPYLRETLWQLGYAVDTLETSVPWNKVEALSTGIENALTHGLSDEGEKVHAFTHLSHLYRDGASIYSTYVYRLGNTHEQTLARWRKLKTKASETIVEHKGTISHQHGVGRDHAPYLEAEKGALVLDCLKTEAHFLDPKKLLNPGILFKE